MRLIARSTRSLALTEEGQHLFERAQRIFAAHAPGSRCALINDGLRIRATSRDNPDVSVVFWAWSDNDDMRAQARALVGGGK